MKALVLFALVSMSSIFAHAIEQGWSLSLKDQTFEVHSSMIRERAGSNNYSVYAGYGLAFFRQRDDIWRLNLGVQPVKANDESIVYAFDANFSFLYDPNTWGPWSLEVRFGPQIFTQTDKIQLLRGVGIHHELSQGLVGLPAQAVIFLGQSDQQDFTYTHVRAGLNLTY